MGDDKKVEQPPLPDGIPNDIKQFVQCTTKTLVLASGKATWAAELIKKQVADLGEFTPEPDVTLKDKGGGKVGVDVAVGGFSALSFDVSVDANGKLKIENASSFAKDIDGWVRQANSWLEQNGYKLGPIKLRAGRATIEKVAVPATGTTGSGTATGAGGTSSPPPKTPDGKGGAGVKVGPSMGAWIGAGVIFFASLGGGIALRNHGRETTVESQIIINDEAPAQFDPDPIGAAGSPVYYSYCQGVVHNGPGDSDFLFAVATNRSAGELTLDFTGPSGPFTMNMPIGADGAGEAQSAINRFGDYELDPGSTWSDGTPFNPADIPGYQPFTVGPTPVPCGISQLVLGSVAAPATPADNIVTNLVPSEQVTTTETTPVGWWPLVPVGGTVTAVGLLWWDADRRRRREAEVFFDTGAASHELKYGAPYRPPDE